VLSLATTQRAKFTKSATIKLAIFVLSFLQEKQLTASYIQPTSADIKGGTFVEIHGTNLDLALNTSVLIKNSLCTNLR
jgi:hypothetical protein